MKEFFSKMKDVKKKYDAISLKSVNNVTKIIQIITIVIKLLGMLIFKIYLSTIVSKNPKKYLDKFSRNIKNAYKTKSKKSDYDLKINTLLSYINGTVSFIKKPFHFFLAPFLMYIKGWELRLNNSGAYDAEKFSDNFASSYGYAKEVAEIFTGSNLSKIQRNMERNKLGMILYEADLFGSILLYFSDPHPSQLFRVNYAKKKLEYELQNNKKYLTKNQIQEIERQIREIDELLKNSESLFIKVNEKLNKYFNYDEKKDKHGSRVTDKEIFDFEVGVLKELKKYER
jgi:hypothetical protein